MNKREIVDTILKQRKIHEDLLLELDSVKDKASCHGHLMAIKTLDMLINRFELELEADEVDQVLNWKVIKEMFIKSLKLRLETISDELERELHPTTREAYLDEMRSLRNICQELGDYDA